MDVIATGPDADVEQILKEEWQFGQNFWDDKVRGYEILNANLRNSLTSIREFERYVRECANNEDQYLRQINKSSSMIEKFQIDSTLSPVWFNLLRDFNEHTSWSHLHFMNRLNDLAKELRGLVLHFGPIY